MSSLGYVVGDSALCVGAVWASRACVCERAERDWNPKSRRARVAHRARETRELRNRSIFPQTIKYLILAKTVSQTEEQKQRQNARRAWLARRSRTSATGHHATHPAITTQRQTHNAKQMACFVLSQTLLYTQKSLRTHTQSTASNGFFFFFFSFFFFLQTLSIWRRRQLGLPLGNDQTKQDC